MSIKVMTQVWEVSKHKGSALLLLLALADHAADDGYCWPNITTLAKKIRMNERSVRRLLEPLETDREVYIIRSHRNHRYVVRLGMPDDRLTKVLMAHGEPGIVDKLSAVSERTTVDKLPASVDKLPGHSGHPCPPNHHEPSMNHQKEAPPNGADSPGDLFPPVSEPPPQEGPSILSNADPLSMMAACKEKSGGKRTWTVVGPDGANPYEGEPLAALRELLNMPELPPPKKRRAWGQKLRQIGEAWEADPPMLAEAIRGIRESKDHQWRSFTSPFAKSFEEVVGVMITRVRSGERGNVIRM